MAAPAFAAAGAGATTEVSAADLAPACPATVNAGELLIIHTHWEGSTIAPVTPSGWTSIDSGAPRVVGATSFRMWTYGKIADGTEDGTSISLGAVANTNSRHAIIYSFSSVRNDTVANVVGGFGFGQGAVAQVDDTGVTTPEADCLAVNLVSVADDNPLVPFTGMTGGTWTEPVADYQTAVTTPDTAMQLQTATMASAGTINGGAQTMVAADPWGVVGFYIRGVLGGGAVTPRLLGTLGAGI